MQGASDLIPNPKQGKNSRGVFHQTAGDCRRLGKGSFKIKKKGSAELPEPEPDFVSSQKNWYLPFILLELLFF